MGYLILDGNYLLIRSLCRSQSMNLQYNGIQTGGIYLFLKSLWGLKNLGDPIVVFDSGHAKFRKEIYPLYKFREEGLVLSEVEEKFREHKETSFEYAEKLLPLMGIPVLKVPENEADDIAYRLTEYLRSQENKVTVGSDDGDWAQMVLLGAKVHRPMKKDTITYDSFQKLFGHPPELFTLFKSLVGDGSDSVSGCPGFGPATANKVLSALKGNTPEDLLAWAEENQSKMAVAKKVVEHFHLVIKRNIKLMDLRYCELTQDEVVNHFISCLGKVEINSQQVYNIFTELGFSSFGNWLLYLRGKENKTLFSRN